MADFISGKHSVARVYLNNQPWNIKVKSTKVQEMAAVIEDNVNGENRARLQKLTNFFHVTHVIYDDGNSSQILQNYLINQANEDANNPALALNGGLLFKYLDGTKGGYTMRGCSLDPFDLDIGGRTERVMHTVSYRAQYFELVPAV